MRIRSVARLVVFALASSAVAQTTFCVAGDLDRLSPAQMTACRTKAADLRSAVRVSGAPDHWHFVVVCDETGWSDYASFAGGDKTTLMQAAENTDRNLRFTFLRGSRMEEGNTRNVASLLAAAKRDMPQRAASLPNMHTPAPRPNLNVTQMHMPDPPQP